MTSQVALQISP